MARLTGSQRRSKQVKSEGLVSRLRRQLLQAKTDLQKASGNKQKVLIRRRISNLNQEISKASKPKTPMGRSVSKSKDLKIRKRMNTDSGESEKQEWGRKGQPTASQQTKGKTYKFSETTRDKKGNLKVKDKKAETKTKTENKTESSSSSNDSDRAAWLKKTRNSPAAKAGLSDDQRWEAQKRHREWKKKRKK